MDEASSSGSEILFPMFSVESQNIEAAGDKTKNQDAGQVTIPDIDQTEMDTLDMDQQSQTTHSDICQSQMTLPDISLTQRTFQDISLTQSTLPDISLTQRTFQDRSLTQNTLPDISLTQTTLPDVSLLEMNFPDTTQSQLTLTDTSLSQLALPVTGPSRFTTPDTGLSQLTTPDTGLSQLTLPYTGLSQLTTPDTGLSQLTTPDTGLSQLTLPYTGLSQLTLPYTGLSQLTTPDTGLSQLTLPYTGLSQPILPGTGLSQMTLPVTSKTTVNQDNQLTNLTPKMSGPSQLPPTLRHPTDQSQIVVITGQPSQVSTRTGQLSQMSTATSQIPQMSTITGQMPQMSTTTGQIPQMPTTTGQIPQMPTTTGQFSQMSTTTRLIPQMLTATGQIPQQMPTTSGQPSQMFTVTGQISQMSTRTGQISQMPITTGQIPQQMPTTSGQPLQMPTATCQIPQMPTITGQPSQMSTVAGQISQMPATTGPKYKTIQNNQCHINVYTSRKPSIQGSTASTEAPNFDPYEFREETPFSKGPQWNPSLPSSVVNPQTMYKTKSSQFKKKPKTTKAYMKEVKKIHNQIRQKLIVKSYSNLTDLLIKSQLRLSDTKENITKACEELKQKQTQKPSVLVKKIKSLKVQQDKLKILFNVHNSFCRTVKEKTNISSSQQPTKPGEIIGSRNIQAPTIAPRNTQRQTVASRNIGIPTQASRNTQPANSNTHSDKASTVFSMNILPKYTKISTEACQGDINANSKTPSVMNVNTNLSNIINMNSSRVQRPVTQQHSNVNLREMTPKVATQNNIHCPSTVQPVSHNTWSVQQHNRTSFQPLPQTSHRAFSESSSEDFPTITLPPSLALQLNNRTEKNLVHKTNIVSLSTGARELHPSQKTPTTTDETVQGVSLEMSSNCMTIASCNSSQPMPDKNKFGSNTTGNISQIYQTTEAIKVLLIEDCELTPIFDVFPSLEHSNINECSLPSLLCKDINVWPTRDEIDQII